MSPELKIRAIDLDLMETKPQPIDRLFIYNVSGNRQQAIQWQKIGQYFVKTDEPSTVTDAVTFVSQSLTNPNSTLKFGSQGEFEIYSDGINLYNVGNTVTGKIIFKVNNLEIMSFNPTGRKVSFTENTNALQMGNCQISYDGNVDTGIEFKQQKITFHKNIELLANIETGDHYISYAGGTSGIHFRQDNIAFTVPLYCNSLPSSLFISGDAYALNNIFLEKHMNKTGVLNKGLYFDSLNRVRSTEEIYCDKSLYVNTTSRFIGLATLNNFESQNAKIDGSLDINSLLYVGGSLGLTQIVNLATANTLEFKRGILINIT